MEQVATAVTIDDSGTALVIQTDDGSFAGASVSFDVELEQQLVENKVSLAVSISFELEPA